MLRPSARRDAPTSADNAAPTLWTLQRQLAACSDWASMLAVIGGALPALSPVADRVSLALVEVGGQGQGETLRFYRLLPTLPDPSVEAPRVRVEGTAVGAVARDGQPRIVADTRDSDGMRFGHASHAAIRSTVSVPIRIAGRVVGVLNAGSTKVNACAPWMIGALGEIATAIGPWLVAAEAAHRQLEGVAANPPAGAKSWRGADDLRGPLVAHSAAMAHVLKLARRAAASDAPVLITGEASTGKAALARAIHAWSRVADGPLRRTELRAGAGLDNDATWADELLAARGGTWLLQGLDALPLDAQGALRRALNDSSALAGTTRIVATSRADLSAATAAGRFRRDLLDRLEVLALRMPPLRERSDDLEALASDTLARLSALNGRSYRLLDEGRTALLARPWRGNLRELEAALAGAAVLEGDDALTLRHLALTLTPRSHGDGIVAPADRHHQEAVAASAIEDFGTTRPIEDSGTTQKGTTQKGTTPKGPVATATSGSAAPTDAEWPSRDEHERRYLLRVLSHTGGRIEGECGAARLLGLEPSTLRSRAQRLGIDWNVARSRPRRRP